MIPAFKASRTLTMGLELELQIVDAATGLLSPSSNLLYDAMNSTGRSEQYALEATLATIEINSGVHESAAALETDVLDLVKRLQCQAEKLGLNVRGGGTHLSQFWNERQMAPTERAAILEGRYGFLPKRFSTYGMHVHIGVENTESAIRLANGLQALVPLLIAMSAASPFLQFADTGFSACRPLESLIYPHGGPMPRFSSWNELGCFLEGYCATGLCESLKDIYWDVRPKPEFGTVEVRVFDTPLTVRKAVALAAFCRRCAALLLAGDIVLPAGQDFDVNARTSRFFACKDGINAKLFDPFSNRWRQVREWWPALASHHTVNSPDMDDGFYLSWLKKCLDTGDDATVMRQAWNATLDIREADLAGLSAIAKYSQEISGMLLNPNFPVGEPDSA